MLSLGGLALGVGMLVDNAIVVLENIYRHRFLGKEAVDAAIEGTQEVGAAVFASTLTTIAVFIPIIFIEGFAAQIFTDLSLTVTFSLISSLGVAMSLVPLLASRMLAGSLPTGAVAAATELAADDTHELSAQPAKGLFGSDSRPLRTLDPRGIGPPLGDFGGRDYRFRCDAGLLGTADGFRVSALL